MRLTRRSAVAVGAVAAGLLIAAGPAAVAVAAADPPGAAVALAAADPPGAAVALAAADPPGAAVASASPGTATPGSQVTFAVSCGSVSAASATLYGQPLGLPGQIAMNAGVADGDFRISVILPASIKPGTYRPDIDCSDGSSAAATLAVTDLAAAASAHSGAGTTSAADAGLTVAGVVLISVGAVAGGIALRRGRRRSAAGAYGRTWRH